MAVYDKEKERADNLHGGGHDDLGIHPERREAEAADLEQAYGASDAPESDYGLRQAEEAGGVPQATKADQTEKARTAPNDTVGSGFQRNDKGGLGDRLLGKFKNRKKKFLIAGGTGGLLIGGSFGLFTILQGPLQFVHASQLYQRFHFGRHDNFSDDRSGKFVLYMFAGKAAKGRLGAVSNTVADKWEKRLNEKAGLKSVYSRETQRLIGYEVVDRRKAQPFLSDMKRDGIPTTNSMRGVDINGEPLSASGEIIDLRDDKFRTRRSVTRTTTRSIGINRLSSAIGSRLLIKRAGVDFHPLKNVYRGKADNYLAWRQEQKDKKAEEIRNGNPNAPESASSKRRKEILTKLKTAAQTAKGPALAVAAVCGTKSFGDGIDAQNYENQLQLMRAGMDIVATGSQVQSNKDFNMEILGVYNDYFYNEENKTSWLEDPGVQDELGREPTGQDFLKDAKPGSKKKPLIFDVAEEIPDAGLCKLIENVSNIEGIKQGLAAISGTVDMVLGKFGIPSPDELMKKAIAYFSTGGINAAAEGSERGGIWNIGVRLAANEKFIASGARELTEQEGLQAKEFAAAEKRTELANASPYEKYFDIYNSQSVAAQMYMQAPKNKSQFVASIVRLPSTLGNMATNMLGRNTLKAATNYNYGFPLYGFSLKEQNTPAYENPFSNAAYIEEGTRLQQLNEEYGNECFGMTISENGDLVYGEAKDYTKIPDKCKDTTNTDLIRYRFYIADIITGHTLACYEGDEASCRQFTPGTGTATENPDTSSGTVSGDVRSLAQQILANPNITYPLDAISRNGSTKAALEALARGERAPVTCGNAGVANTDVSPNVLKFLADLGQQTKIGVNALTDKCHSRNSNHYKGTAVDFECNAVAFNLIKGDQTAAKYGGKRNSETCAGQRHWHYDF